MPDTTFPTTLRAWRGARNLSREAAGELLHVPARTIEAWEQGRFACRQQDLLLAYMALLDRCDELAVKLRRQERRPVSSLA